MLSQHTKIFLIVSTPYIKQLLSVAKEQNLVAKTSLESTVKLLLIVELDRAEQERKITVQRIKDGIAASDKKSGRPVGKLDKMKPPAGFLRVWDMRKVPWNKKYFISSHKKDNGQRELCGCMAAKDIGEYNTCPHLCEYCYANASKELAIANWKQHQLNPNAETITGK